MPACYTLSVMMPKLKIAPSILAADLTRLGEEIAAVEAAGADMIHVDVMDGHYVPNLSFGPMVVEALRRVTKLPLDVHLMISNADQFLKPFADAGADTLTVHLEACTHIHRTLHAIRELGIQAGLALNPGTPVDLASEIIADIDLLLLLCVNPGFGGQQFIERSIQRIQQARSMLDMYNPQADIEVDGGIDQAIAERVVMAGANILVAGTAIFGVEGGPAAAVRQLRKAAQGN